MLQFATTKLNWSRSDFWQATPQEVVKQMRVYERIHSEKPKPTRNEELQKRKQNLVRLGRV